MGILDDLRNALNPVSSVISRHPAAKIGARFGPRVADDPRVRALLSGTAAGLSPGRAVASSFGARSTPKSASRGRLFGQKRLPQTARPSPPRDVIDPLGELYASLLEQLQAPVAVDESDLMAQIRAQFDPVFDARRAALQQMMAEAQTRSQRGRQEVVNQYESLGQNYEELAPQQLEQAEEQQAATEQLYGQLKSNIEGNYSRIQEEQADLFAQLGIEEALPQVLSPQGEDAQQALTRADEFGTLAQQRQADVGNIEADYYRSGAPIARMTGANRSSEMLAELESYLRGRESDLTMLEAERTSGIQSAFTQLLQQAQSQAQEQEMFQQRSLMDLLMGQMQAQQQEPPDLTNPQVFLQQLPGGLGNEVLNAYQQIQQTPEIIENKQESSLSVTPGTLVPATAQLQMQMAEQLLNEGAIDNATYQSLLHFITLTEGNAFAPSPLG